MVEQRTENPCVPGSIPGGTTKKDLTSVGSFFISNEAIGFSLVVDVRVTFFIAKKVTMVRPAIPHPSATAHQPNLVALKTH